MRSGRRALWKCRAVDAGGKLSSRVTGNPSSTSSFPPSPTALGNRSLRDFHIPTAPTTFSSPTTNPNGSRPKGARPSPIKGGFQQAQRSLISGSFLNWGNGPLPSKSLRERATPAVESTPQAIPKLCPLHVARSRRNPLQTARKHPIVAAHRYASDGPLRGVVVDLQPPVFAVAGQRRPVLQRVARRLARRTLRQHLRLNLH